MVVVGGAVVVVGATVGVVVGGAVVVGSGSGLGAYAKKSVGLNVVPPGKPREELSKA